MSRRLKQGLATINSDMVIADGGGGHGTLQSTVRRFTNISVSGQSIDVNDSADSATQFIIREKGYYGITYQDRLNGPGALGITLNAVVYYTQSIVSVADSAILARAALPTDNNTQCTAVGLFNVDDVIVAHTDGVVNGSGSNQVKFIISRLEGI